MLFRLYNMSFYCECMSLNVHVHIIIITGVVYILLSKYWLIMLFRILIVNCSYNCVFQFTVELRIKRPVHNNMPCWNKERPQRLNWAGTVNNLLTSDAEPQVKWLEIPTAAEIDSLLSVRTPWWRLSTTQYLRRTSRHRERLRRPRPDW